MFGLCPAKLFYLPKSVCPFVCICYWVAVGEPSHKMPRRHCARATFSLLACFVSNDRRIYSWCIGSCSGCHHSQPSTFRMNLCTEVLDPWIFFSSDLFLYAACTIHHILLFQIPLKIFTIINATQLRFLKRLVTQVVEGD